MLKTCPDKPNCVSSLEKEKSSHKVETFPLIVDEVTSRKVLIDIIENMPRTKLVKQEGSHLHFTFTSLIFRFVDDVEFVIGDNAIHVRSASRVGYSDLGVNRKRIDEIREAYKKRQQEMKPI